MRRRCCSEGVENQPPMAGLGFLDGPGEETRRRRRRRRRRQRTVVCARMQQREREREREICTPSTEGLSSGGGKQIELIPSRARTTPLPGIRPIEWSSANRKQSCRRLRFFPSAEDTKIAAYLRCRLCSDFRFWVKSPIAAQRKTPSTCLESSAIH